MPRASHASPRAAFHLRPDRERRGSEFFIRGSKIFAATEETRLFLDAFEEGRIGEAERFGCFHPAPAELVEHPASVAFLDFFGGNWRPGDVKLGAV